MRITHLIFITFIYSYVSYSCKNESSVKDDSEIKFGKNNLAIKYLGQNQFKVYLASNYKFEDAIIEFGHYDKITHTLVLDDSTNIVVRRENNYFLITNNNLITKNGYVKIDRNGKHHFDYLLFEMRKE